jgi:hypothetical protein
MRQTWALATSRVTAVLIHSARRVIGQLAGM